MGRRVELAADETRDTEEPGDDSEQGGTEHPEQGSPAGNDESAGDSDESRDETATPGGSDWAIIVAEFEGFLGMFLVAVFVFTLTRSIRR